ncbi:hypothetical protein WN55_06209 [Dufourea novaeangliae]|uniref:Uncharacterized protein n=1 Tax=Dufourea novaeangliae TaxID=178035 RepID=A0A154PPB9_DUFNO|nr:hypothetical protein WN55_06209 [Dufourea novaeangliae]
MEIEEVEEYKYLGYHFIRDGGPERQVRERVSKGVGAMREVWRLGKRVFKDNIKRRLWFYDSMVWAVMG